MSSVLSNTVAGLDTIAEVRLEYYRQARAATEYFDRFFDHTDHVNCLLNPMEAGNNVVDFGGLREMLRKAIMVEYDFSAARAAEIVQRANAATREDFDELFTVAHRMVQFIVTLPE